MITSDPSDHLNPERFLDRVASMSRDGIRDQRVLRSEVYHRVSSSVRVGRSGPEGTPSERVGAEEGTAVRLWAAGENGYRFAATTGSGSASVDRLVREALEAPGPIVARTEARPTAGRTMLDHDPGPGLPSVEALTDRLDCGLTIFRESRRQGEASEPDQAWVEVAATVESWVADGKPLASRSRCRGWALVRPAPSPGISVPPRPMLIAGRSWDQLDFGRWSELRGGTVKPDSVASNAVDRRSSFVLNAETSAALVLALVRSVHTGHGPTGSQVGPGWRVWDAPEATEAVFGGKFDDSGFRAARKALADGRRRVGRIDGDGHSRRPSFRDLPRDLPSHLIVDPPDRVESPEALRVDALSIHPLPDGRWVLDLGGLFVTTHPEEMLNSCVAGVGANRSSYRGVETPALLFEGLEIRV